MSAQLSLTGSPSAAACQKQKKKQPKREREQMEYKQAIYMKPETSHKMKKSPTK